MIGETISHYRILKELGRGAMGVVYLAEHTELGRRVAIKTSSSNPGRFLREARAASALSHPHIATIHDYGKTEDGQPYIVMEYVEGETLAEILAKKTLAIPESLRIARQVADALGEAHRAGIVHRDIKPANIAISDRGIVKVLDFGLAKLIGLEPATPESGDSEPPVATQTREGAIVGTPMYFSPEQAVGGTLDARSDLFSLGLVLYECLAGKPAFPGSTPIEICAKVIRDHPGPPSAANNQIPEEVDRVVLKALEKNQNERYQTAQELSSDLKILEAGFSNPGTNQLSIDRTQSLSIARPAVVSRRRGLKIFAAVVLAMLIVTALSILLLKWRKQNPPTQVEQVRLGIGGNVREASISPDGKFVSYVNDEGGKQSIWLRQINTGTDLQVVAPGSTSYKGLSFFPNGDYLSYLKTEGDSADLYQVSTFGGAPRRLASNVDTPVSFSPDGTQYTFVRYSAPDHLTALITSDVSGNNEKTLATLKEPQVFSRGGFYSSGPAWSPDGLIIAVPAYSVTEKTHREVILVNVADGKMNTVNQGKWNVIEKLVWLADGSGFLMNASESKSSVLQVWLVSRQGDKAMRITKDPSNYVGLSATKDSQTVLTTRTERASLVWIQSSNSNSATQIPSSRYSGANGITWTPDGKFVFTSNISGSYAIWMMDADGANRKQITFNDRSNLEPAVSPDGQYIVFASFEGRHPHLWRMDSDGTNAKQLTEGGDEDLPRFTPDGKWLIYHSINQNKYNIRKISIDGGDPVVVVSESATQPDVSPDGKLLAYFGRPDANGSWKVTIVPLEGSAKPVAFELPAGVDPEWPGIRWAPDGESLVYVATLQGVSNLWRQALSGGEPKPVTNFQESRIFFDWSRNDRRLVLVRGNDTRDLVLVRDFLNAE